MNIDYLKQFVLQEKNPKPFLPTKEKGKLYRFYFICWLIFKDKKDNFVARIETFHWTCYAKTENQKEKCFDEGWEVFKGGIVKGHKERKIVAVAPVQVIPAKFASNLEWVDSSLVI